MVVKLSELRVAPEFVEREYVAGAGAAAAANDQFATSASRAGAAVQQQQPKISQAGNALAQLSRRYIDGYGNTVLFQRGIDQLARSFATGSIEMERAEAILAGMTKRLGMTASATDLAAQGHHDLARAVSNVTAKLREEEAAAARANGSLSNAAGLGGMTGAGGFAAQNTLFQLQDIGVTAAMGMNPLQIALQQGTQISAVLGPLGAAGAVKALGAAFVGLVNPVSLLTIGLVAGTAALIQWATSARSGADEASEAQEKYNSFLDETLRGYDEAQRKAKAYVEEASRLPRDLVLAEGREVTAANTAALARQMEAIATAAAQVERALRMGSGPEGMFAGARELSDLMHRFEAGAISLEELRVSLADLRMRPGTDKLMAGFAEDIAEAADEAGRLRRELGGVQTVVDSLSVEGLIDATFASLTGQADALEQLRRMTPDLRTAEERAREIYAANSGSDADGTLARQLEYTLAQLAGQRAQRASGRESPGEKFGSSLLGVEREIEALHEQARAMALTTMEAERQRVARELLNAAQDAGLAITEPLNEQIGEMADRYAQAHLALMGLQTEAENQSPWATMADEIARLNEMLAAGTIGIDAYAGAMGRAAEKMVGEYAGAARGLLGIWRGGFDALGQMERARIENSGLAGDELTAALETQAREQFEVQKKFALANAVVAGAEAVVKSYNWGTTIGGPVGGAIAAGVAAEATEGQAAGIAAPTYLAAGSRPKRAPGRPLAVAAPVLAPALVAP